LVDEFAAFLKITLENNLSLIQKFHLSVYVMFQIAIHVLANMKGMQMRIRPAHGSLKVMMQLAKTGVTINDQLSPDRWIDSKQFNVQGKSGIIFCHGLRWSVLNV